MLYTGKSPLEAPLILRYAKTDPYQTSIGQEYRSLTIMNKWDRTQSTAMIYFVKQIILRLLTDLEPILLDMSRGVGLMMAEGAQWLSGRVLDSRPRGGGFEPHRRHCVVVIEQDTFILA